MPFNFLSGQSQVPQGNLGAYSPNAMQAYAPAWNTGQPQGMDYSQVLGGGMAQNPATQGLDYSKIGQWALSQPGNSSGGYAQALQALAGPQAQLGSATTPMMPGGRAGDTLGTVNQQQAGYIGRNQRLGLLGAVR